MNISNQDVLHSLNQQTRSFQKAMNKELKEHGLYGAQWTILFCLHTFGAMTQTGISRYLHVEAPTVTRTLVKMEKTGWIVRKQGTDKRERLIEQTEKAEEHFPAIKESIETLEHYLLEDFTEEEKQQLYQLLHKMKK